MQPPEREHPEIVEVIRAYVEGMTLADEARLRTAFHPDAFVVGNYRGALERLSLEQFVAAVREAPVPADAAPDWTIVTISKTGDAAVAVVEDTWLGLRFTDFLSLLIVGGTWTIVHKLYFLHPASTR